MSIVYGGIYEITVDPTADGYEVSVRRVESKGDPSDERVVMWIEADGDPDEVIRSIYADLAS